MKNSFGEGELKLNAFSKTLIVAIAILFFIGSAQAISPDIALHADINAGRCLVGDCNASARFPTNQGANDANIGIIATGLLADTNYFIAVIPDAGTPVVISDIGVVATGGIAGVTGTVVYESQTCLNVSCAVIQTGKGSVTAPDANFDVNFMFPANSSINSNQDLNIAIFKANTQANGQHAATFTNINDANILEYFIVTPAVLFHKVRPFVGGPKMLWNVGDWNVVTVRAYGVARKDLNYQVKFQDANKGAGGLVDLNVYDVNYVNFNQSAIIRRMPVTTADSNVGLFDRVWYSSPVKTADGNANMIKWNRGANNGALFLPDLNGFKITPDANRGNFDVNIIIPWSNSIGGDSNIIVRAIKEDGTPFGIADINTMVIIIPTITMPADINVTVLISTNTGTCLAGRRYSVPTAMINNCIADTNNVSSIEVRLGDETNGIFALIKMNNAVNLTRGPSRNYDNSMDRSSGKAGFNIDQMPEFNIDANITLYNVKVPSSKLPPLVKNGRPCSAAMCTNVDGTALSGGFTDTATGVRTWVFNPDSNAPSAGIAGDGNLTFRVKNFSTYQISTLSGSLVAPNGFEQIRQRNTSATDTNYTINFTFTDENYLKHSTAYDINIYLIDSNSNAVRTYLLINDTNIWSSSGEKGHGLLCNNDANFMIDKNLQKLVTCTFDWNVAAAYVSNGQVYNAFKNGVFTPIGEWKLDINILKSDGNVLTIYADNNFTLNAPNIKLVDANLNVQYSSWDSRTGYNTGNRDGNKAIDFNVYVPDGNALENFSVSLYLSSDGIHKTFQITDTNHYPILDSNSVPTAAIDSNLASFCGGTSRVFGSVKDYNCQIKLNTAGYPEGSWYVIIDVNRNKASAANGNPVFGAGGRDQNVSPYTLKINDTNLPTVSFTSPSTGTNFATGTTAVTGVAAGTDDSGRIKGYYFWKDSETTKTWVPQTTFTNLSGSFTFSSLGEGSHTLYTIATDWSDNNSATQNRGIKIDSPSGGTTTTPPSTGGTGGDTGITPGTEEIINKTSDTKPTEDDIRNLLTSAGASETAIEKASEAVGKTTISREVSVEKTVSSSGVATFVSTVTFTVSNPNTTKVLQNVKVLVEVPKAVAKKASDITVPAGVKYRVVKDDPIIEFEIDEIGAGGSTTVSYAVAKQLSESTVDSIPQAVVAEFQEAEADLCPTMDCNDSNPCTTDTCSGNTCYNDNVANGTSCGTGKECKAGACVAKTVTPTVTPPVTPPEQPAADYTIPVIIVVIIVLVGLFMVLKGGKKKNKLTYK